jgi:hypothetical protein
VMEAFAHEWCIACKKCYFPLLVTWSVVHLYKCTRHYSKSLCRSFKSPTEQSMCTITDRNDTTEMWCFIWVPLSNPIIMCLSYKPYFSLFPLRTGKTCSGSLVLFGCGIKNMSVVQSHRADNFYIQ